MLLKCKCKNEWQDARYGTQVRVKNPCKEGARCTVCKDIDKTVKGEVTKKEVKSETPV